MNFPYTQKELDYLSQQDARLGAAIAQIGKIEREINPDVFSSLITSIIAQQISGKAAAAVQSRVEKLLDGDICAAKLAV